MSFPEVEELSVKGADAIDKRNWLAALACFEKLVQLDENPVHSSYFAACIAKERGQFGKAVLLCRDAIEKEPDNPVHYLNLGRVYLFQGQRGEAVKTFREGLSRNMEPDIIEELNRLGMRKKPVIPFLSRDNPANKFLGKMLKMLRLR
jgi:tetratricopeptide (TPR) repeat protein